MITYRRFGLAVASILFLGLNLAAADPPPPTTTHTIFLPMAGIDRPAVRIAALYYDSETTGEPDEAFRLWNVSSQPVNLAGYQVGDGAHTVTFPALTLPAGEGIWCTREAAAFTRSFGVAPDCEYGPDSDPSVPNLAGAALRFSNTGGQAVLRNPGGDIVDVLVYEGGDAGQPGWHGPAVAPYSPSNSFSADGQILYRKFDWQSGQPVPDTNARGDWAQDPADHIAGRRVQYPGWDLDRFARAETIQASAALTVSLAPDNVFDLASRTFARARHNIVLESYSFEHVALAEVLAARARAGVAVTVLLEGGPAGGLTDQERYTAQLIESAGGQVWFMASDRNDAEDRYASLHAKFAVIDGRLLLVSSENFGLESMPNDDKRDGTLGRRGAALVTDAQGLVQHAQAMWAADFDPAHHADLFRWSPADPKYGAPPAGFVPVTISGGSAYQLVHPQPLSIRTSFAAQVVQAPETSLLQAEAGGVLGLVGRAGAGDTVLVQQLYERVHWGGAADTPATAPNLRLAAYVDAARRGARVRILLDSFFDQGDNAETVAYLNQLAQAEQLDLKALLGNPTGAGVHNKLILVQVSGQGWLHVGSLNGSEASAKLNRELALQVQSNPATNYLATAFWSDWRLSGGTR